MLEQVYMRDEIWNWILNSTCCVEPSYYLCEPPKKGAMFYPEMCRCLDWSALELGDKVVCSKCGSQFVPAAEFSKRR